MAVFNGTQTTSTFLLYNAKSCGSVWRFINNTGANPTTNPLKVDSLSILITSTFIRTNLALR